MTFIKTVLCEIEEMSSSERLLNQQQQQQNLNSNNKEIKQNITEKEWLKIRVMQAFNDSDKK